MQKYKITIILIFGIQLSGFCQWEEKNINTNSILTSVDFLNNEIGYVTGGNKVFKTTNGGDSWVISFTASGTVFFENIVIIDDNKIIAVGKDFDAERSLIIRSENGGGNWETINISNSAFLKSVFFISTNIGYCSGGGGTILKSVDSGKSWQELDTGTGINLQSIYFVNEMVGVAVGGTPISAVILKTQDGGNSWNEVNSPTNNNLQSVFFTSPDTGYVVGWNGEIIRTEDCGNTWTSQNSVEMSGNLEVVFTDNNTGYIVGGQLNESLIQKTINGGELWEDISPTVLHGLTSIVFPFFDVGYAVGGNGTVVKTQSGGIISSTDPLSFADNVQIYPNPANNKVWIESKENVIIILVRLYDTNGRLIKVVNVNAMQIEIDCALLESNIYYFEIQTENENSVKRFVKS